ncbi:hypothetical protein HY771_01715 [Candidatus Uhrbacteria bacterium]|nr:hypothetical protein [Candidatus Uhrbacteria bacterium]MBI4812357.1 hypothetical protein [Candidatus Falkowbacteria bacterium]
MPETNQSAEDLAKIKGIYNYLAGQYNSSMAKSNWCFASVDSLQPGMTRVLPREFVLYPL